MLFSAIIVGDEILLGKRRDTHIPFLVETLKQQGHELVSAQIVGDDAELLTETLRRSFADAAKYGWAVFSFGGIGATPDDRTRQCAADALGIPLEVHAEGQAILESKWGQDAYPQRIKMVEFPSGAALIPNPVNQVPGFSIQNHYFVPGFPSMSHPMVEWALQQHYPPVSGFQETRWVIENTPESQLIPIMEQLLVSEPMIKVACLPSTKPNIYEVDLGLRGPIDVVERSALVLEVWLQKEAIPFHRHSNS